MSKLRSSIQKAVEKSRMASTPSAGQRRGAKKRAGKQSESGSGVASGVFRIFKPARPDEAVMRESRIVSAVDEPSVTAAYNLLRTRVIQRMRSNKWRTLLVTSPGPGEGKTLTASNLAVSLSRDVNQSVLLVDLDLRRSTVAKYLGFDIDLQAGIGDFLMGKAEISDIVYVPGNMERIGIIPNRQPLDNASDLLGSPKMKELLGWLENQPEETIVIFDMPPVLVCDDVLAICPEIDAVLMVAAQGLTDRSELEKAMQLLEESEIIGVVLNRSAGGGSEAYGYY